MPPSVKAKARSSRPSGRKSGVSPTQKRGQDSTQTPPSERKRTPTQKKDMILEVSEPFMPSPNEDQAQLSGEMTSADEPPDKVEAAVLGNKQPKAILAQLNGTEDKVKAVMEQAAAAQLNGTEDKVKAAMEQAAAQKFKEWYEKYTQLSDPKTQGFDEVHDRRRWIPEMCAVGFILAWTSINAATSMAKQKEIADILISVFVIGIFLIGPICGMWVDKRYCHHHEMALLKCGKPREVLLTWVLVFLAFQFGVITVFQTIGDGIDVSFYVTVVFVLVIAASVLSVIYLIIPYGKNQAAVPTWKDVWDSELIKKYERKANRSTGKKAGLRVTFYWNAKVKIMKGMCKDVLMLGMFWKSRAPTFAKCAVIHVAFDTGCELIGAAWFIVRLFSVCICLSLLGGLTNAGKQVIYTFKQKKRISGLDYGAFEPPHIRSLKLELQLRLRLNFGIDLPELPNLKLPMLALDDLLTLLPNLPELPNFDIIAVDFPSVKIDWDALKLQFPNVPSLGMIDIPNLPKVPNANEAFPSFSMCLSVPTLNCDVYVESMMEAIGDVLGAVLAIVFALGEISVLTDEALMKKEQEAAKEADIAGNKDKV